MYLTTASTSHGESDLTLRSGGRVPNTNKHSGQGSNPVWLHAYENEWYKPDDRLSRSERDSLDENAVEHDARPPSPDDLPPADYHFYHQMEQINNAKNMETTEL